ncbi:hypothetical protein RvY_15646 [Ramazzottius varieornatus]|uniref:Uncharacterized protein n=1 Tax=Ramazzottius varieornatus TaxID=947166 RepID=A0A1D1W097_RAMVA|nr:hypothetical protein RvY_15646 [Ramazzottius varieornatus]
MDAAERPNNPPEGAWNKTAASTIRDESSLSSSRRAKAPRQKTFPFRRTTPYKRSRSSQVSGPDDPIVGSSSVELPGMDASEVDRSSSPTHPSFSPSLLSPRAGRERSWDRLQGKGLMPVIPGTDIPMSPYKDSSSSGKEYDIEDLCRKKSLRKVLMVIQEDDKAENEAGKIPEKFLTPEALTKLGDRSKYTINLLDKLQKHFMVIREKLYRARYQGMDQGIEAVQKGDSPLLEQHMSKIQNICQDELRKAKDLQESRKESIELEYSNAAKAVWDTLDAEVARRQYGLKVRLVESMIKSECDFMQTQLRNIVSHWKEQSKTGDTSVRTVNGITINVDLEIPTEELMGDVWKLMKTSIRQKYWTKYLSPKAQAESEVGGRAVRAKAIQAALLQSQVSAVQSSGPHKLYYSVPHRSILKTFKNLRSDSMVAAASATPTASTSTIANDSELNFVDSPQSPSPPSNHRDPSFKLQDAT